METEMNIGQAAEKSGLPAKTIRYYEDIGLIAPDRSENGYRDFSDTHIHKLTFLHRSRNLGFSIDDCRTLLSLYEDKNRASGEVQRVAKDHISAIELKIAELQSMQATLSDLVHKCHGDDRPDCPILDQLSA
jgi:Cu(I)-responsive transcriptional regulator